MWQALNIIDICRFHKALLFELRRLRIDDLKKANAGFTVKPLRELCRSLPEAK
jgi:hypothetical protein